MPTAIKELDSDIDSGFGPSHHADELWLSDVREPNLLLAWSSMQQSVDGSPTDPIGGGIPAIGHGFGYDTAQYSVAHGRGDFFGITDDHSGHSSTLCCCPAYRKGAGAPFVEQLGVGWTERCGSLQPQWVYPRDALTGIMAVGGPQGDDGTLVIPATPTSGSGTVTGLAFEPHLLIGNLGRDTGFASLCAMGFGICGPDLSQWSHSLGSVSFGSPSLRKKVLDDDRWISIVWGGAVAMQIEVTGFTSDGFTYNYSNTSGDAWSIAYIACYFESEEIAVGVATEGTSSISTGWRPEGALYASVDNSDTSLHDDVMLSVGGGTNDLQRVASMYPDGRRWNTGVIRLEDGNIATHALASSGINFSWSGGSNNALFGYLIWGRSRATGRGGCYQPSIYRLVKY
jgi:hypothetical protein